MKYAEVYLHNYQTVRETRLGLARYFHFYNTVRLHEFLGYKTPIEIYFEDCVGNPGQANETSSHVLMLCKVEIFIFP